MSLSRLTAYVIATRDDIVITAGGPDDNGKWMGMITLGQKDNYRPLLSSKADYDTKDEAKRAAQDAVAEIRRSIAEELGGQHPIDIIMGNCPEAAIIKKIVEGVQAKRSGSLTE